MTKKYEVRELDIGAAISGFETRISGLLPRIGERVEVQNIREDGDKYTADIVCYYSRDLKGRWQVKEGEQVQLSSSKSNGVVYLKSYIDFLARHPFFGQQI